MAAMGFSGSNIVKLLMPVHLLVVLVMWLKQMHCFTQSFRRVDNVLLARQISDYDVNKRLLGGFAGLIGGLMVTPGARRETVNASCSYGVRY